jgi:hypothetical protein
MQMYTPSTYPADYATVFSAILVRETLTAQKLLGSFAIFVCFDICPLRSHFNTTFRNLTP